MLKSNIKKKARAVEKKAQAVTDNNKTAGNVVVRFISGIDRPLLVAIILLLCIGSIMVLSASYVYAKEYKGDSYYYAKRQLLFVILGFAAMIFTAKMIDYNFIRRFSFLIFGVATVLMVAVLLFGIAGNGAQRWIYIGPISVQPSEIMKFAVVLLSADYIAKYHDKITQKGESGTMLRVALPFLLLVGSAIGCGAAPLLVSKLFGSEEPSSDGTISQGTKIAEFFTHNQLLFYLLAAALAFFAVVFFINSKMVKRAPDFFYGVLPFILIVGIAGGLLIAQPHLSGFIIISLIVVVMMVVGGTNMKYIYAAAAIGTAGILVIANLLPHAKARFDVWHDPFSYIRGDGWQPAQSLYAIGSGGLWGVGLGNSRQKHLYLPEPHNDYIFAVLCEELGFLGAIAVIALFVFFVYRGIVIAMHAPDRFSSLLVLGIISHVGLQALLNMLVVTNTLPSTGISLPFFSYGGSSLVILLIEMGVVLSVSKYSVLEKL